MAYASEGAFRAALNARISAAARRRGWVRDDLARAVALQVFVGRLFDSPTADLWILTGGTALQFRAPTQARPTRDADLATAIAGDELQQALQQAVAPREGEFGEFTVTVVPSGTPGLYAGTIQFIVDGKRVAAASLDLSHRAPMFVPDQMVPEPIVAVDGLRPLPPIHLNSVPDALADKVAAMYELHGPDGTTPSTRYHDLADLLILIGTERFTGGDLRTTISEQERRRGITIPVPLTSPGPLWATGYPKAAQRSGLPPHLHTLDAALSAANAALHPLLSGTVPDGAVWEPRRQRWSTPTSSTPTNRATIARLLAASRPPQTSQRSEGPAQQTLRPSSPDPLKRDLGPDLGP